LAAVAVIENPDAVSVVLSEVTSCTNHCKKLWVIASAELGDVGEAALRKLVDDNALAPLPHFVGRVKGMNEVLVLYKGGESERHKAKKLTIDGRVTCMSLTAAGNTRAKLLKTVQEAFQACDLAVTTLALRESRADGDDELCMEAAFEQTEHLSATELAALVGNARLCSVESRTPLQRLLVKCEPQLKAMRARSERARMLLREVGLENPRPIPLKDFVGLSFLVGQSLDPVSGRAVTANFEAYLRQPELHLRYSAVLLGRAGLGKTPLAISFCAYAAAAYQGHHYGTPADKATFIVANTIDLLKECTTSGQWRPYTPLFLDEFEAGDARQQGILGENTLKVLVDVMSGGTLRARYHDVAIPAACPRIFASNVGSQDEWLQHLGCHPEHRAAILKRTMFFTVTSSVLPFALRGAEHAAIEVTAGLRSALDAALSAM
jgi:hypothetical protein